jgi:hypothetical protein
MLTLDGVDVLKNPTTTGNTFGASIESIALSEAGPGQVSRLSFTLDDPAGEVGLQEGASVWFMDLARDVPLFAGWVESFEPTAWGLGRTVDVSCVGIEIVLDWRYVPTAITFSATTTAATAIQSLAEAAIGIGVPLRVGATSIGPSTLALPIGGLNSSLNVPATVGPGTLRQCLIDYLRAVVAAFGTTVLKDWQVTVDFRGGLRVQWVDATTGAWTPSDYAAINVSAVAGILPSGTRHRTNSTGASRQVYVSGGNAAGTGVVAGGSSRPGPVAVLSDPNSLDATYLQIAGGAYLAANGTTIAGEVTVDDGLNVQVVGSERRAGMQLTLTDPNLGLTNYTAPIVQIDKTFAPSGVETWTIRYGRIVSGMQYLRRLTRAALVQ